MLENLNLSHLTQNHSSVTRLKQFVYRCQMYNTTESLFKERLVQDIHCILGMKKVYDEIEYGMLIMQ